MLDIDWRFTLVLVTNGVMIGLMYTLIALGFVLVYKATDAINFAQGEFVMFAGMIAAGAAFFAGLSFWLCALIALAGMIMRNTVILVDQIERDIAAGHARYRAIIDATVRRARPVVLTALAAVLGMIPLARSIFWGPMAITIMGGLLVATVLTLLVVPALYALWFRVRKDEPVNVEPDLGEAATPFDARAAVRRIAAE